MSGGAAGVAQIFKANLLANDRAATIVAQNVKAAAGAHSNHRVFPLGKIGQCLDSLIKAGHLLLDLLLNAKDGSDGLCVFPDALNNAQLGVGGEVDYRRNLAERIVGGAQAAADEDDVRLTGHHRLQIGLLDGAEIFNRFVGHILLQIVQRGACRTDHPIPEAKIIQHVQRRHVQDGDALWVIGDLQLNLFSVPVQAGDGNGGRSSFAFGLLLGRLFCLCILCACLLGPGACLRTGTGGDRNSKQHTENQGR